MTKMLNNAQRKAHLYDRLKRNFPDWSFEISLDTGGDRYFHKFITVRGQSGDCNFVIASPRAVDWSWCFSQYFYWKIAKLIR
jgi:hypothetical protein